MNNDYTRQVDQMPSKAVLDEIDKKVDQAKMEDVLMQEGTLKFADPQKALLKADSGQARRVDGSPLNEASIGLANINPDVASP